MKRLMYWLLVSFATIVLFTSCDDKPFGEANLKYIHLIDSVYENTNATGYIIRFAFDNNYSSVKYKDISRLGNSDVKTEHFINDEKVSLRRYTNEWFEFYSPVEGIYSSGEHVNITIRYSIIFKD